MSVCRMQLRMNGGMHEVKEQETPWAHMETSVCVMDKHVIGCTCELRDLATR